MKALSILQSREGGGGKKKIYIGPAHPQLPPPTCKVLEPVHGRNQHTSQPASLDAAEGLPTEPSVPRASGCSQPHPPSPKGADAAPQQGDGTTQPRTALRAPRTKLYYKQLLAEDSFQRNVFNSKQRCPKSLGALRQADIGNSGESLQPLQIFIPPLFVLPLTGIKSTIEAKP